MANTVFDRDDFLYLNETFWIMHGQPEVAVEDVVDLFEVINVAVIVSGLIEKGII